MADGAVRRADASARVDVRLRDVGGRSGLVAAVRAAFVVRVSRGNVRLSATSSEEGRRDAEHTSHA
jgi:hypothetical protein